jgi:hypothetical protein
MDLPNRQEQILQEALTTLETTTDLKAIPLPFRNDKARVGSLIEIRQNGYVLRFVAEIKAIDRRIAAAQIKTQLQDMIDRQYPGYHPLLITGFMTPSLAETCRQLGLAFIDTAGNIFLRAENLLIDVRGKARPNHPFKNQYKANKAVGLKIVFALLCRPALAGARYREIATFARVALGAIGPVLKDLTQRGYLQRDEVGSTTLVLRNDLLQEWVTYYPAVLRPILGARRYQADREKLTQADLQTFRAYWGGEYGAELLTRYLKAQHFTIYVSGEPTTALMTKTRMRLAADGNTEILDMFWDSKLSEQGTAIVPPLLIYADLMTTGDPRNLEAAKKVYERFLADTTAES